MPLTKNDLNRYFRLLHGWLSALAFVALCFFSFTGLLLNHPEWFSDSVPEVETRHFVLTTEEAAQVRVSDKPAERLIDFASQRLKLKGELNDREAEGDLVGSELFVRLQGIRGTSFLRADLKSGSLEVTIENAPTLMALNELHRAERAGKGWRLAVDAIAVLLIVLSLVGYLIFWSMRGTRLRTALVLTLSSSLGLFAVFVYAVS